MSAQFAIGCHLAAGPYQAGGSKVTTCQYKSLINGFKSGFHDKFLCERVAYLDTVPFL